MRWQAGDWAWSAEHDEACRLVEVHQLWGQGSVIAWLPTQDVTVRLSSSALIPVDARSAASASRITYVAAAARVADALGRDELLAPLEGTVIPLPHQLHALSRAMSGDRVRYLLADEVGLGKTIEAGLVLRELKVRGLVKRILVVAPTGLVTQWVSEMSTHFNEDFRLVVPGEFSAIRKFSAVDDGANLWRLHDQVVCPMDSVKPLDSRRGWSTERVRQYNRERFQDLISAGWDLVIIDEAHRLGGSTEQVARYRLGEGLAQAAPYLLLLSATPHQGKTDAFRRILSFLDEEAFPDDDLINRESVGPFVIRTEKRNAIDAEGQPLFKPRHTQIVPVAWGGESQDQRVLYDAVTEYVREGYNQARREKNTAIGFLMILMQRLVTSSVRAIRTALERRLATLELPSGQLSLFGEDVGEEWANLDSQDQMESILKSQLKGLKDERAEVELLLSAARRCEAKGPDTKAQALLDWIHQLEREEGDPNLKVLAFTEFVPTQQMLAEFLTERGFEVVSLNGSLNLDERQAVQRAFAEQARVLISTDAGGEGLNLQFCHVIFNYDLPWNPMKLEQRIGRVDRIGQRHVVRAQNFALEDTVELRVREVLEEKLQRILEEFGVDKLADVLDSEEGGVDFDSLYLSAVLEPEEAEARVAEMAERVRERASASSEGSKVLGATTTLDAGLAQRVANHQLPYWTERMTVSFLRSRSKEGVGAEPDKVGYRLQWPDGDVQGCVVFDRKEADAPGANFLSVEDPHVRGLASRLPRLAPGQPVPSLVLEGISDKVSGTWSLWRIALSTPDGRTHRMMPLFCSDEGRMLAPTARAVWDRLVDLDDDAHSPVSVPSEGQEAAAIYELARQRAEKSGQSLFEELLHSHRDVLTRRKKRGQSAFDSRQRAIERIGLPQVRAHRLRELQQERDRWLAELAEQESALPELSALLILRVAPEEQAE